MQTCKGRGECLLQTGIFSDYLNIIDYYKDENIICLFNCEPIKCPNYLMCNNKLPLRYMDCYNGICCECDMTFGTWKGSKGILNFYENQECPICFENSMCISQPKCNHYVCIKCFKRSYCEKVEEPVFPYDYDILNKYIDNPEHTEFENDELIIKYKNDCELFDFEIKKLNNKYKNESFLRCCPLCRK